MEKASSIPTTPSILSELTKSYLFKDFTSSELTAVLHLGTREILNPGEEMMARGALADAFYVVHYGSVRTHIAGPQGQMDVTTLIGNGGVMGVVSAVAERPRLLGAEIVERTELFVFPWAALEKHFASHHEPAYKFYRGLSQHLAQALQSSVQELARLRETHYLERQGLSAL
jgi:CRP-like cAMP-binding protein